MTGSRYKETDLDSLTQWTSHGSTTRKPADNPYTEKLKDFFRFFKLQSFGQFRTWKAPYERRKIALHNSRRIAAYHCLLHLVPLGGALSLLALSFSGYFVGPDFSMTTPLQFAAKFLELLMQASIVEVVYAVVRTQMIDGFIPLGALSALLQTYQITYLWSLDFISAISSHVLIGWRRFLFTTLVPILILLTALVGPSSAILMIPRSGITATVWTKDFLGNGTREQYFPSRVNITSEWIHSQFK